MNLSIISDLTGVFPPFTRSGCEFFFGSRKAEAKNQALLAAAQRAEAQRWDDWMSVFFFPMDSDLARPGPLKKVANRKGNGTLAISGKSVGW